MNRETFQAIRDLLMEKLDMSREMTDREILDEIDQLILNRMRDSYISLNEKLQLRQDRKSTRLNSSHSGESRMPSSA